MRVKATSQGFDNLVMREAGDEFDMPDDTEVTPVNQGGWFVKVEDFEAHEAAKPKAKAKK